MKAWSALVLVAATVVLATGAGSSADAGAPLAKDPSFEGGG